MLACAECAQSYDVSENRKWVLPYGHNERLNDTILLDVRFKTAGCFQGKKKRRLYSMHGSGDIASSESIKD